MMDAILYAKLKKDGFVMKTVKKFAEMAKESVQKFVTMVINLKMTVVIAR